MFIDVVTLVTLAIFWGLFEADFLSMDAKSEARGQRSEVKEYLPTAGGVLKRTRRAKRAKPMFAGFFAISKRTTPPPWYALKRGFGPMFIGLGTAVRFEKRLLFNR